MRIFISVCSLDTICLDNTTGDFHLLLFSCCQNVFMPHSLLSIMSLDFFVFKVSLLLKLMGAHELADSFFSVQGENMVGLLVKLNCLTTLIAVQKSACQWWNISKYFYSNIEI